MPKVKWDWHEYEPQGDYVPIERWGKDHWSTLLYLETCAVDKRGKVDNRRMRCDPRLHRELANTMPGGGLVDGSEYPTRLRNGGELEGHDDWSCLEDMAAAGLIKARFRRRTEQIAFGNSEAKVAITAAGAEIVAALRRHKANGAGIAAFICPARREV